MKADTLKTERRLLDPGKNQVTQERNRYFDFKLNINIVRVLPGEHYITDKKDELIVTILGSCVAACIRDPKTGIGGMNHFMLPESNSGKWGSVSANMRYGNFAMETLINEILRTGCPRERLEVKLFGGGNVTPGSIKVGDNNGRFALNYLKYEGLAPITYDLGGIHARRIHYNPVSGKVDRLLLKRASDVTYLEEEKKYLLKLPKQLSNNAGEIDLF